MHIIYDRFSVLPFGIRTFCFQNNGWIVGGAAKYLIGITNETPRDYDIIIPLNQWNQASKSIPKGSTTNSWGGIKLNIDNLEIDIWGDNIDNFAATTDFYPQYAINLKNNIILTIESQKQNDST